MLRGNFCRFTFQHRPIVFHRGERIKHTYARDKHRRSRRKLNSIALAVFVCLSAKLKEFDWLPWRYVLNTSRKGWKFRDVFTCRCNLRSSSLDFLTPVRSEFGKVAPSKKFRSLYPVDLAWIARGFQEGRFLSFFFFFFFLILSLTK